MTRFWTVQFVGLCLLGWSWHLGWLRLVWDMDQTRMSTGILLVSFVGLAFAALRKWEAAGFIAECLLMLGLIGTVIGAMIAFAGIDPAAAGDVNAASKMVGALLDGIGAALMTTAVGCIGFLWIKLSERLST